MKNSFDTELAYKIITELFDNFNFEKFARNRNFSNYSAWRKSAYNLGLIDFFDKYDCFITTGSTRMVIVVRNKFVIKIPMNECCNYCECEYLNYLNAVNSDYSDMFAEMIKLDRINLKHCKLPVYLMEYCDADERMIDSECNNYEDYDSDGNDYDPYYTLRVLMKIYGYNDEIINDLIDFCEDNEINDLHSGNLGFSCEDGGLIKIIDYAGYRG